MVKIGFEGTLKPFNKNRNDKAVNVHLVIIQSRNSILFYGIYTCTCMYIYFSHLHEHVLMYIKDMVSKIICLKIHIHVT